MVDHLWFKMYPKDWIGDPELRLCSLAEVGLLSKIMCLSHEGDPYGYLKRKDGSDYTDTELSEIFHVKLKEYRVVLAGLIKRRRVIRDKIGIYVPRLVKERAKYLKARGHGLDGGNPLLTEKKKGKKRKKKTPAVEKPRSRFEEFWSIYPKKREKRETLAEYTRVVSAGIREDVLIDGAKRYAKSVEGEDPHFTKHPTRWLKKGCWSDEYDADVKRKAREAERKQEYDADMKEYVEIVGTIKDKNSIMGKGDREENLSRLYERVERRWGKKAVAELKRKTK